MKLRKSILGVISSMIIILGLLNTFSVYTFVEDYIFIKYLLIFIHFIFIILIIYNKKLKDKIKQIDVIKMTITAITFFCYCFLVEKYLEHNQMSYGYYLIFLGIILQVIYYTLTYIKINNKVKEPPKEEVKEVEIQDKDIDPEII